MATPKEEDYGVYDPLPALADLPGGDQRFYNDMYNDSGVPQEVAADAAGMPAMSQAPAIPETGMRFDFGSLNVQTKEDFAALPDEQKELLRAMKRGVQFTEESAAKFVLGQRERQQKMADETAKAQNSPEAKAEQDRSLASTQSAYDASEKIVSIMDRLRGYAKGAPGTENKAPKYFGRVGPVDSKFPESMSGDRKSWFVDFRALQDQLALAERGSLKGQGSVSNFEQEMLRNAAMGGLDFGRDDTSFAQVFEQTYDIAKKKREEHKAKLESLKGNTSAPKASTASSVSSFSVGAKLTDKFGRIRVFRGMDQNGQPILDPVQ